MTPAETVDIASKIASSQFAGFVVLMLVVIAMGVAFRTLWQFVRSQIEDMRRALDRCQKAHEDCQKDNTILARAVIDQSQGFPHEARARAQTLLMMRDPTANPPNP